MRRAPPFPEDASELTDDGRPSKSALKRQMHDLQDLGQALSELPASRLAPLNLPDNLRDALTEYRRIRAHEGRRRQLQYLGKLMRQIDAEPIREAVAAFKLGSAVDALALHQAERWREEMLASDEAITRWMHDHPDTDAQQLRSLVRSARKDAKPDLADGAPRHARAYRELFQLIKAATTSQNAQNTQSAEDDDDDRDDA